MRTTSSVRLVGESFPPMNVDLPFTTVFGAGKIPAFSNAVVFAEIMHAGIVLLGNASPCTMPAGRTPPGQFRPRTALDTEPAAGTLIVCVPKSPPYVDGSGTG